MHQKDERSKYGLDDLLLAMILKDRVRLILIIGASALVFLLLPGGLTNGPVIPPAP